MNLNTVNGKKIGNVTNCVQIGLIIVSHGADLVQWRRDCWYDTDVELGCAQHVIPNENYVIDACFCAHDLCNEDMGPLPTTTPEPSHSQKPSPNSFAPYIYSFISICVFAAIH